MWTKRYLLAIILLGISLCSPTDKAIHGVQAASNDFDCTTVSEIPQLECEAVVFNDNNGDGTFVGLYDDFTLDGRYRFVIYGQAGEDDLLMPTVLEMEFEGEVGQLKDGEPIINPHVVYLPVITR